MGLLTYGQPFFQEFNKKVVEGFQVTPLWHQGFIRDDGRFALSFTLIKCIILC